MLKILIVDDDIATVDVIYEKMNWGQMGVDEVFKAYNIQNAKEILKAEDIAVIISDIEMPQGSGIDLLEWCRQNEFQGEFILLTCHERFDYATNALKLQAAEYLLKPFDVNILDAAVKRAIIKVGEKQKNRENIELGKWVLNNRRSLHLDFIRAAIEGRIKGDVEKEIAQRGLDFDAIKKYRLFISRVTDVEKDVERMNPGLVGFVLQNIHSEVISGSPEQGNVVLWDLGDSYVLAAVIEDEEISALEGKAKELSYQHKRILGSTLSICISSSCNISEFGNVYYDCIKRVNSNVAAYGSYFFQDKDKSGDSSAETQTVFERKLIAEYLEKHEKAKLMGYLKKSMNDYSFANALSNQLMVNANREMWQAVHGYFMERRLEAETFFKDETALGMEQKSTRSVMDFLRWAGYLVDQIYEYEEQEKKSQLPLDKIKQYIQLHYMENISRVDVADELGLSPEYVSKLFKRESGMNLTDYLARYRVEQAKLLLERKELSITEISEATGFENSTYFSTTFKKYTGMTPNAFRKG